MRVLLDLMRENEASAQISFAGCEMVLETAGEVLTILDPGVGQEELISRTGQTAHAIGTDGPDDATQHTAIMSRGWLVGDGVERVWGGARFAKLMTCISEAS